MNDGIPDIESLHVIQVEYFDQICGSRALKVHSSIPGPVKLNAALPTAYFVKLLSCSERSSFYCNKDLRQIILVNSNFS